MGLGKTVEILYLIHSNLLVKNRSNTETDAIRSTLIICPLNVIEQWRSVAYACIGDESNLCEVYYGSDRNTSSVLKDEPLIV